ncbi:hypothetical protein HYX18_04655, partial [Candidatus Woesearchaeota archaeon]|nr:hypothetical protein [Candidatus Woesearchaeota archaeon]
ILIQCFTLDKLNINKKELHRPVKHIIIKNNNPVMIDFERCYLSKKPKNLTQFCQFLINKNVDKILKDKNININKRTLIRKLKIYKNNINKRTFDKIVSLFF